MTLTFGSLFAGIGGIDLGLERAGMVCKWQVEIDEFCRKVLTKHWPDVPKFGDIKELTGDELGTVDVLAGGFPCQPVSYAGKRKAQEDARWLWPEFARIIRLVRPRIVLVENVPGLFNAGFGDVIGDLASLRYDAEWDCISASALGAHHIRNRVFVVAHTHSEQLRKQSVAECWCERASIFESDGSPRLVADTSSERQREQANQTNTVAEGGEAWTFTGGGSQRTRAGTNLSDSDGIRRGEVERDVRSRQRHTAGSGPELAHASFDDGKGESAQIRLTDATGECEPGRSGGRVGQLGEWLPEPEMDRVAHGVPYRVVRSELHALGNAVVPRVAEWVGRRVIEVAA